MGREGEGRGGKVKRRHIEFWKFGGVLSEITMEGGSNEPI